jgi:GGDEF domain-containing protein
VELQGGRIWAESEWGKGSSFRFIIPRKVEQPVEQIINPLTKLLTWKHFLTHFERIYSFCKRRGKQFGLLQIRLALTDVNSDYISVSEILRKTIRRHEILTHKDRGCYHLIILDADRQMIENAASRISAVLKEKGYNPILKTTVFMEDGETIEEMLKILDNSDPK